MLPEMNFSAQRIDEIMVSAAQSGFLKDLVIRIDFPVVGAGMKIIKPNGFVDKVSVENIACLGLDHSRDA